MRGRPCPRGARAARPIAQRGAAAAGPCARGGRFGASQKTGRGRALPVFLCPWRPACRGALTQENIAPETEIRAYCLVNAPLGMLTRESIASETEMQAQNIVNAPLGVLARESIASEIEMRAQENLAPETENRAHRIVSIPLGRLFLACFCSRALPRLPARARAGQSAQKARRAGSVFPARRALPESRGAKIRGTPGPRRRRGARRRARLFQRAKGQNPVPLKAALSPWCTAAAEC